MPRYSKAKPRMRKKRGYKSKPKYRSRVPRTLQVATRRPTTATLKFVKNLIYKVNPGGTDGTIENTYLTLRANSIYNILQQDGGVQSAGTWTPQDSAYAPGNVVNAEGYSDWKDRFQHYTVLGSKLSAVFTPQNDSNDAREINEATFYLSKAGGTGEVNALTAAKDINKMPYTRKTAIKAGETGIGKGGSLSMNYSAKKFEGLRNVIDNATMKGQFGNAYASASQPTERSYFNIGIVQTIPATALPPKGILKIQLSYIVKLTEPTGTNRAIPIVANL
jgi:hypothetical protein